MHSTIEPEANLHVALLCLTPCGPQLLLLHSRAYQQEQPSKEERKNVKKIVDGCRKVSLWAC